MIANLKTRIIFQEKENLAGKKENFLIIDCKQCSEKEKNFYNNKTCIYCFLHNLFVNKNSKFNYILISKNEILIEPKQFELFLEYFKKLNKIKRINQKIEKVRKKRCIYQEFKCKYVPDYFSLVKIHDFEFYDPILVYNIHFKRISFLKENTIFNNFCLNCVNYLKNLETSISKTLNNLRIIKLLNSFEYESDQTQDNLDFYKNLFSKSFQLYTKNQECKVPSLLKKEELINTYIIGTDNLYQVYVSNIPFEAENKYLVSYNCKSRAEEDYIKKIVQDISNSLNIVNFDQIIPLENLINLYKQESLKILNKNYRFAKIDNNKIAFISALKRLNLEKIFPLLIDDFIEEIFLDSPYDEIYINHQQYGRCRTNIKFNISEIERIKTLLRLYSGQRLDFMNPSLKLVLKNKFFYCRFALDIEPINLNNFALDIRKLNKNILNIQDLLKKGSLNPLMATFLYFIILRRRNITVTGETDTGKTTLINALDLLTPKEFRKIYVENIVESLNQFNYGKHQLKYKIDSYDSILKENYSKSSQIKTLLHRTPDMIYLGEILTKEEAKAMFHCLAAGLRGFQTIHTNNIDSLINRFIHHFKINKSCLNDLDIIILMKKDANQRKIISISEIGSNLKKDKLYNNLFQYNPESKKWNLVNPLFETKIINELRRYEDLSRENFSFLIKIYNEIFTYISKANKVDNYKLINFFDRISYNSFQSNDALENFWYNWKNNRGLNL